MTNLPKVLLLSLSSMMTNMVPVVAIADVNIAIENNAVEGTGIDDGAIQDDAADEREAAVAAMHRGDFAQAYCLMKPLAEAGDAESQYNIGWMYHNGYGMRVDDRKALRWWQRASDKGNSDASFSIGMLYSLGEGKVAKDEMRAIDYYLLAAQAGNEDAISLLQYMMMENDELTRSRLHEIANQHASLFGSVLRVSARKLNAREGPSLHDRVVTRLQQGQSVLALQKKGKWRQLVVLGEDQIEQAVWVHNRYLEKTAPQAKQPMLEQSKQQQRQSPASGSTAQHGFDLHENPASSKSSSNIPDEPSIEAVDDPTTDDDSPATTMQSDTEALYQ